MVWVFWCVLFFGLFFGCLVSLSEIRICFILIFKASLPLELKLLFHCHISFAVKVHSFHLKQTSVCCIRTSGSDFVEVAQKLPFLSMEAEYHV